MNICYSGGSMGADQLFGEMAEQSGHKVVHWSFQNHHSPCKREFVHQLPYVDLLKADPYLKQADLYLKRTWPTRSEYVNNLLRRNYYQIKDSERLYASCAFDEDMKPLGGTAWAIVMAMQQDMNEIYVFDHTRDQWFSWLSDGAFSWLPVSFDSIPYPHGKYAGIGSSKLPKNGRQAIIDLYMKPIFEEVMGT